MKKIFLLFVILSPLAALAQVSKGSVFLGGTVTVVSASANNGGGSTSAVELKPRIGFFLNEHNALGGGVNIMSNPDGDLKDNTFGFAFFHRYYKPITESFFFILHSEISADFEKVSLGAAEAKFTTVSLSTGPRFAYFASKHWSFEAGVGQIGYSNRTTKADNVDNTTTSNFFLNAGAVSLGIFYYIPN